MSENSGTWIMRGREWDDPERIKSPAELIDYVNKAGLLPLFKNSIPGFSAEEQVSPLFWWTGDPAEDPWEWREQIARSGKVAYGRFFGGRMGFVSLQWLPVLGNCRRDGYDFDARWDDGLADGRCKKIMDCFEEQPEWSSAALKKRAGFGKNGEKNFEGMITALQMQTYLVIKDFRRRQNRQGLFYGMPVSIFARPEDLWGAEFMAAGYEERPEDSRRRIFDLVRPQYPCVGAEALERELK